MLTIIKIELPYWELQHRNGKRFTVKGFYSARGDYIIEPPYGWTDLTYELNQDFDSLYEEIDNLIYSAMPELYDRHE